MTRLHLKTLVAGIVLLLVATAAPALMAETSKDLPPIDPEDNPFNVVDGKVDSGTYNGYRRYHASCHTCHGPAGNGSTFAPALKESVKTMDYAAFLNVVVNGRDVSDATGQRVMPSFGVNPNVMNHIDDIWGYLKARSAGAIGPERPQRYR